MVMDSKAPRTNPVFLLLAPTTVSDVLELMVNKADI